MSSQDKPQGRRDELAHRQRQIQAMRRTALLLSARANVEELLRDTLELAVEILCADAGSLVMHNPRDNTFTFRHVIGPIADRLIGSSIPVTGIAGRAFHSGEPVLCCDAVNDLEQQRIAEVTGYAVQSMMSVPLKNALGEPFGTMQILNSALSFDEGDLEVLEVIGAMAAAAIEQTRLTQEARRAELVSLIGDISHDIKNMLTPIQTGITTLGPFLDDMFIQLEALYTELPHVWRERLENATLPVRDNYGWILENAYQAGEQVQARTLEIANAVKGESAPLQLQSSNANAIAAEIVSTFLLVADKAGVQLSLDPDADLPRADLDRKQIYNALYNLVSNAVAATPAGGQVIVRTRSVGEAAIRLEVQDSGHGIPPEVQARLFSSEVISTKPGGTGLGTKIIGDVVRRHQGDIQVHSVEGQGATFSLCLPLHPKPAA